MLLQCRGEGNGFMNSTSVDGSRSRNKRALSLSKSQCNLPLVPVVQHKSKSDNGCSDPGPELSLFSQLWRQPSATTIVGINQSRINQSVIYSPAAASNNKYSTRKKEHVHNTKSFKYIRLQLTSKPLSTDYPNISLGLTNKSLKQFNYAIAWCFLTVATRA